VEVEKRIKDSRDAPMMVRENLSKGSARVTTSSVGDGKSNYLGVRGKIGGNKRLQKKASDLHSPEGGLEEERNDLREVDRIWSIMQTSSRVSWSRH